MFLFQNLAILSILLICSYSQICLPYDSTKVYHANGTADCVIYQDKQYLSLWWNQGNAPTQDNSWNNPWKVQDGSTNPIIDPIVDNCKNLVSADQQVFQNDCITLGGKRYKVVLIKDDNTSCQTYSFSQQSNCDVLNCSACSSNNICSVCKTGYHLVGFSCEQDINCTIGNCASCSSNDICFLCNSGYYLSGNKCLNVTIQCQIQNCVKCSLDNICSSCSVGYQLSGNICTMIQIQCSLINCATCSSNNVCSNCMPGYQLQANQCLQIAQPCTFANCQTCTNGTCSVCNQGYNLTNGQCTLPVQPIQCNVINCLTCQQANICQTCNPGYQLQNGICQTASFSNAIPMCEAGTVYNQGSKAIYKGGLYEANFWVNTCPPGQAWKQLILPSNTEQCKFFSGAQSQNQITTWQNAQLHVVKTPNYQKIIGYMPTWKQGKFDYGNWDPKSVTNTIVSFLTFKENNDDYSTSNYASPEFSQESISQVKLVLSQIQARAQAAGTKVQVAVGGAEDCAFFWLMKRNQYLKAVEDTIVNFVNQNNIDGIDLDFECQWPITIEAPKYIKGKTIDEGGRLRGASYAGATDEGPTVESVNLKLLAQGLRNRLPNKILSGAFFASPWYGNNYDADIHKSLDWIALMTYDFSGSWLKSPIGPHSSLYKIPPNTYGGNSESNPIFSAQDALEFWTGTATPSWNHAGGLGVPKEKLCFGVAQYGYEFYGQLKLVDMVNSKGVTIQVNKMSQFWEYKNVLDVAGQQAAISYDKKFPEQFNGKVVLANGHELFFETPALATEKLKYSKSYGTQGLILWELTQDLPPTNSLSLLGSLNNLRNDPNFKQEDKQIIQASTDTIQKQFNCGGMSIFTTISYRAFSFGSTSLQLLVDGNAVGSAWNGIGEMHNNFSFKELKATYSSYNQSPIIQFKGNNSQFGIDKITFCECESVVNSHCC